MILLALACVLLAAWGAGSLVQTYTHAAPEWLGWMPRLAAALIFTGMFFGPARDPRGANMREPDDGE